VPTLPARKNCTKCGRWLLCCLHFHVAERDSDGEPKRLQSWCKSCQREASRIRNGRRRRGYRYNKQRTLTKEQRRKRRNLRHRRWKTSLRHGDPLLPIDPLVKFLRRLIAEEGLFSLAAHSGLDQRFLDKIAHGIVVNKNGRIERQRRIRLSVAERILDATETNLTYVWDPDLYPWLYTDKRPRPYPTVAMREHGIPAVT
jgi:hypothetical protein